MRLRRVVSAIVFALLVCGAAPAFAQDAPVRGQSVIGADDRTRITQTSVFPFSAVVFLELQDAQGEFLGSCSGAIVGPDTVLTAGHCLWDATTGDWLPADIRIVPGKDGDFEPFGDSLATDFWVPDAYAAAGDPAWDWGLIKLADEFLTLDTGWMTLAVLDDATLAGPAFTPAIVGYPADRPLGEMWGHSVAAFSVVEAFRLFYDIDTAIGQSGSVIWSYGEGEHLGRVVGIHTQGGGPGGLNAGSRIDQQLLDDLLQACAVMDCTIAHHVDETNPLPDLPFKVKTPAIARD